MEQQNHQRFISLWIGLGIVLVIGLSVFFELFNSFDRWMYDEVTIASQFYASKPPQVLLIEIDTGFEGLAVKNWFSLLKKVNQFNPSVIAINIMPWNWSEQEIDYALQNFPLIIGSAHPDIYKPHFNIAFSALPALDGNTYRQQHQIQEFNKKNYPGLESAVARKVTGFNSSLAENYYINFIGGPGRLPIISSQRVIKGGLVDALVKGRAVLIGIKTPLMTNIPSPLGMMPYSSYQAYALDTLLNNNAIIIADSWFILLLVIILVFVMLLAALKIPDQFQLIFIISFIFFTVAVSYLSLLFFNYWLMPGYLLITEFSVLVALLFLRNQQNRHELQRMALSCAARIESHRLSDNLNSSDAHWNYIANMVTQTLSLERTIFLERVENDHRIREIKALNCSLDDISEMRRDYQRTPYTTAIEHGGAYRLERTYLEDTANDEVQYLMPLSFMGGIQGFWAFTIKQNTQIEEEKLIDAVEQFAMQISEMLYHWSEWGHSQLTQRGFLVKLLKMKFEENTYNSINHSINFLTHRLSVMETVMDGLETHAILYDLFGRVLHVNKSMTNMLGEIHLLPYSMTMVDLIVNLAGCSLAEARNYLSNLILEQGSINITVNNKGIRSGYMMVISALKSETDYKNAEGEIKPFEIVGILCELIDMSHIRELYSQKEKLVQHMSGWLRNDLSSISIACDLVQDDRLSNEKNIELVQLIKEKVVELGKNFEKVNSIVQQDLVSKAGSQYPVDYIEQLHMAIKECTKKDKKKVLIQPVIPFFSPLVMASPKGLRKVFTAIINILISDALEESEIFLTINSEKDQVTFDFKNQGFGIPQEQLLAYIESVESLDSNEFQNIRLASQQIIHWGELFEASSEIGEGMHFKFSLKAFSL